MHVTKSTKCNENNRTWMIVSLALVVGGVGTLFTITHLTINTIYQAKQQRQNNHKINTNDNTKIMQSMQTCKTTIFIVQEQGSEYY